MTANTIAENVIDPVCGMSVDPASAARYTDFHGHTYHFCSDTCKTKFDADPDKYVKKDVEQKSLHQHAAAGLTQKVATDGSHHTRTTPDGAGERVDFPING